MYSKLRHRQNMALNSIRNGIHETENRYMLLMKK